MQEQLTDPEVRVMSNWHAVQEMEHKAVAFDVFQYVAGTERIRITAMATILVLFMSRAVLLLLSIASDPWAWRHPARIVRMGFHPYDIDHSELLERWRDEYFGPNGVLLDHLRDAPRDSLQQFTGVERPPMVRSRLRDNARSQAREAG